MFVNVEELSDKINKFNSLIEKYEEIYLNIYNTFDESSVFWESKKSNDFYSVVNQEKNQVSLFIEDLKMYNQIYLFLINKYKSIGNKIYYDFSVEKNVLTTIEKYINKYDSIIINVKLLGEEYSDIKNKLLYNKKILVEYRKNFIDILEDIQNINEGLKHKLSEFKIEHIKENDIQQFV